MMIRLVAFSPRDGWALLRQGDDWYHLEPPYRRRNRRPIDPATAAQALLDQNFPLRDLTFQDWGTLVRTLEQERVRSLGSEERTAALNAWRSVLRRTSVDRAREHLSTLTGWIDDGRGTEAERALAELLQAPALGQDPGLCRQIGELLNRVMDQREQSGPAASKRFEWPVNEPRDVDVGARAVRSVAFRRAP